MSIVITEDRGPVRHVILNRPEKRNAMNQELLRELGRALRAAGDDASVRCVVLRGEGPVFSAGVATTDEFAQNVPALCDDVGDLRSDHHPVPTRRRRMKVDRPVFGKIGLAHRAARLKEAARVI